MDVLYFLQIAFRNPKIRLRKWQNFIPTYNLGALSSQCGASQLFITTNATNNGVCSKPQISQRSPELLFLNFY